MRLPLQVPRPLLIALGIVTTTAVHAPLAQADTGEQRGSAVPVYDTATETSLSGVVESVTEHAGMRGRGMGGQMPMPVPPGSASMPSSTIGLHLVLKTGDERIEVHLGPSTFLAEQNMHPATGDRLHVVGSRVMMGGRAVLLARQVTHGSTIVTLRDETGRPLWGGMGRGR